jgi:hypothetical protein
MPSTSTMALAIVVFTVMAGLVPAIHVFLP